MSEEIEDGTAGREVAVRSRSGSEKRQRTEQFRVRLTPGEKADLEAKAASVGMDVAAYVRHQALGTPGPRTRRTRITPELADLIRLRAELGKIGSNLNQLAKLAHLGDLDEPEALAETLARILALLNEARAAERREVSP